MYLLLFWYAVRCEVPHLRVAALYILLHAEKGSLGLVFAVVHVLELGEIGWNVLVCVCTSKSGTFFTIFASTLELGLGFRTVADIGLPLLDELLREFI